MRYYIYTLCVCACAASLFLIANDIFTENLSKGDALGLSLVSLIMLIFFIVELTRIENE
jgi:uncharacterized membrane protein YhaH (DUF805 family)